MNRDSHIIRCASKLLLIVMAYMHLCSAWCAIPSGACCTDGEEGSCSKLSGSDENGSDHNGRDCQSYHLSFFNAIGQFSSEKAVEVTKVFESSWPVSLSFHISSQLDCNKNIVAHSGLHPPPPATDIRILIQSFQI